MKTKIFTFLVAISALCGLAKQTTAQEAAKDAKNVVTLQDDGRALINPQMGWTMHFYSNVPTN